MQRNELTGHTFTMPEIRSAFLAIKDVISYFGTEIPPQLTQPLFLHGPAGVGKSQLVSYLVDEVAGQTLGHVVAQLAAIDLRFAPDEAESAERWERARAADLLVVEDLQHLRIQSAPLLVNLLDARADRGAVTVLTAQAGPRHLRRGSDVFPARLISRLAGGLVVPLDPWGPASRLLFLEDLAQRRQFVAPTGALAWLAEHLPGSGRVLEGALNQLESLASQQGRPLDLDRVARHFRSQKDAHQPTVERIADQVSGYFRLDAGLLQSRCRYRNILLPRQVSMYLARKLTTLSLEQIGAFFGGRDHTTVMHACRKMEQELAKNPVVSGAVRQLHAELA